MIEATITRPETLENYSGEQMPGSQFRVMLDEVVDPELISSATSPYDLVNQISSVKLRQAGLLSTFNIEFAGNRASVIKSAYPEKFQKPRLDLDSITSDPDVNKWKQLEHEIDKDILRSMEYKQQLALKHDFMTRRGRKSRRIKTGEYHREKLDSDEWNRRENNELRLVINRLMNFGDTVVGLFNDNDAILATQILSRRGQGGRYHVVSKNPQARDNMFNSFLNLTNTMSNLSGENSFRQPKIKKRWKETEEYVNPQLLNGMQRHLEQDILGSEDYYQNGFYHQQDKIKTNFFNSTNMDFTTYKVDDKPLSIEPKSVDLVVESNKLNSISEDKIQSLLYDIDRVIAPGGYLIFRENAKYQTLIQYYGEELFNKGYRVIASTNKSRQILVLRKNGEGRRSQEKKEWIAPECKETHKWYGNNNQPSEIVMQRFLQTVNHLLLKTHTIDGEKINGVYIDENLKDRLSLSWFRKVGMFQPLMTEFGGDYKKAADFIAKTFMERRRNRNGKRNEVKLKPDEVRELNTDTKKADEDETTPYSFDHYKELQSPKNDEKRYTLDDLAREIGVNAGTLRRELSKMGLKTVGNSGPNKFTSAGVQSRRINFSSQEFEIVKRQMEDTFKSKQKNGRRT